MAAKKPMYEVRVTPDKGRGLFALRRIPKGAVLGEYRGGIEADNGEMALSIFLGYTTLMHWGYYIIDPQSTYASTDLRFGNHSCRSNCDIFYPDEPEKVYAGESYPCFPEIRAVRQINAGEEITYAYNLTAPRYPALLERWACKCGEPTCRGDMFEVPAKKQRAATIEREYREFRQTAEDCALQIIIHGPRNQLQNRLHNDMIGALASGALSWWSFPVHNAMRKHLHNVKKAMK